MAFWVLMGWGDWWTRRRCPTKDGKGRVEWNEVAVTELGAVGRVLGRVVISQPMRWMFRNRPF